MAPQMLGAALVVAAMLQLTAGLDASLRNPAGESRDSDSPPAGTVAYIVSPNDGRWLFSTGLHSSLRFEAVVIHYGVTDQPLVYDAVLSIDGQELMQQRLYFPTIRAGDQCLDPSVTRWRTGCGEVDIGFDLPSHALSKGSHRAHLHLQGPEDPTTTVQVVTASYHVVTAPKVELSFPWDGQHFACGGPLTLIFGYSTDYEPTRDFLERGAVFHGAALFVNQTRGSITDTGFVTTPPLSHGTHQLRVSLFDHHGREIEFSTSASITIHVSPHAADAAAAAASVADAGGSRVHGASRLGKGEDEDEGGCQVVWLRPSADLPDVALAALAAAATPWRRNSPMSAARGSGVETTLPGRAAGGHAGGGQGSAVGGFGGAASLCPSLVVPAVDEGALPPNELEVVDIDYRMEKVEIGYTLWRLDGIDSQKCSLNYL
jgi:hypothetical protein